MLRDDYSRVTPFSTRPSRPRLILVERGMKKSQYGILDGNALSLKHFQGLDSTITIEELEELVNEEIVQLELELKFD